MLSLNDVVCDIDDVSARYPEVRDCGTAQDGSKSQSIRAANPTNDLLAHSWVILVIKMNDTGAPPAQGVGV